MKKKVIDSLKLRTKLGISQKTFSEIIGVSRDTVAHWESKNPERRTKPSQQHALKMIEIEIESQEGRQDTPIEIEIRRIVNEQMKKLILPLNEKIDSISRIISKYELKKMKKN